MAQGEPKEKDIFVEREDFLHFPAGTSEEQHKELREAAEEESLLPLSSHFQVQKPKAEHRILGLLLNFEQEAPLDKEEDDGRLKYEEPAEELPTQRGVLRVESTKEAAPQIAQHEVQEHDRVHEPDNEAVGRTGRAARGVDDEGGGAERKVKKAAAEDP